MSDSEESSSDREYKTNLISEIADGIPLVGHVKAAIDYGRGNVTRANKTLYDSTRPVAVLSASAAGGSSRAGRAVLGLGGAVAFDVAASVLMNEPQGIVQSLANIRNDVAAGINPMGSIGSAALTIGSDIVDSLGPEENMACKMAKTAGIQAVKKMMLSSQKGRKTRKRNREETKAKNVKRAKVEEEQGEREERANEKEQKSATFGTSSESTEPPTTEEQSQ